MGLKNDKPTNNNVYLTVMNGKLVQKVAAGTEGSKERTNKNNEVVHEMLYTGIEGRIHNIAIGEPKQVNGVNFGSELEIRIVSEGQSFVIQTSATGGYAYGFFARIPNIDFEKDVELRPFSIEDKTTKKTNNFLVVYQGKDEAGKWIKLESAFSKENPNGLPPLTTLKMADGVTDFLKDGKPVWDDSQRAQFWKDMIYGDQGVNDTLIALYGTADQKANAEDKDFENTEVPADLEATYTSQIDQDADAQKIGAGTATAAAASDEANAKKKAAPKKATTKK